MQPSILSNGAVFFRQFQVWDVVISNKDIINSVFRYSWFQFAHVLISSFWLIFLQVWLSRNIGKSLVNLRLKHKKRLKTGLMRRYETFHHAREILPWQTNKTFIIIFSPDLLKAHYIFSVGIPSVATNLQLRKVILSRAFLASLVTRITVLFV